MAKTLDVYLHRHLSGQLFQDDDGELGFQYAEGWLNQASASPLSHSLPLRKERFSRKECQGFFGGILPEEGKRTTIARNLGISPFPWRELRTNWRCMWRATPIPFRFVEDPAPTT